MDKKAIKQLLNKLEISDIEVELYINLLKFGPITISELSRKSNIPRTTTDENSLKLFEKGLVSRTTRNNRSLLVAEPTNKIKLVLMNKNPTT